MTTKGYQSINTFIDFMQLAVQVLQSLKIEKIRTHNRQVLQRTRVIPLGVKDLAMVMSPPLLTRAPFSRVVVY